jgi:putative endopeptidase
MRRFNLILFALFAVCLAHAQAPENNPATAAKTLPGFDVNVIDRSVDPCTNFYKFSCGKWLEKNPVPAEYPSWGRFDELYERNIGVLKQILEKAAANRATSRNPVEQKIGTYYAACMDEKRVEQLGPQPLKSTLDRIAALRSKNELPGLIANLHSQGLNVLFGFTSDQDFKNAEQVIASQDQGGLGLPDRDYYLKTDAESERIRKE